MRYKKVQTKIQYNWFLNKASNNRRELVDGIISGKYLQVDETLLALNDEYVEAVIDEIGKGIFKAGYKIPPGTEVKIIRPQWLKGGKNMSVLDKEVTIS